MQVGLQHPTYQELRQRGPVEIGEEPAHRPRQRRSEDLRSAHAVQDEVAAVS